MCWQWLLEVEFNAGKKVLGHILQGIYAMQYVICHPECSVMVRS